MNVDQDLIDDPPNVISVPSTICGDGLVVGEETCDDGPE